MKPLTLLVVLAALFTPGCVPFVPLLLTEPAPSACEAGECDARRSP
ncbi:hypothetical protein [Marinicauda salina]|nr:hypothetical protein [Marinicauda salina]